MTAKTTDQDYLDRCWSGEHLDQRIFEACTFTNCDFSSSHLHGSRFVNCTFKTCDLGNAQVADTSFVDVKFDDCRLLGIDFSKANATLFKLSCTASKLDYCCFGRMGLKGSSFEQCSFKGIDFRETDLRDAHIEGCDWREVEFEYTDLRGLDLSKETNLSLDPSVNKVKGVKMSRYQVDGILSTWGILISE